MLRSRMARRIYLWLPSLAAFALIACGGSASDFFDNGGGGGSSRAGASSQAGSTSSAGTRNSGSAGVAGDSSGAGVAGDSSGAGAVGVAGSTSSGGSFASGGTGSGGRSNGGASSGGSNSGGRAGSSSGGAGGRTGTGGNSATAGSGGAQAGSPGAGGSNNGSVCDELLKQANQQLEAARECNLAASSIQCNDTVKSPCNCEVAVRRDDSAETKAYLATLKKIDDKKCVTVCTAQVCKLVTNAQCRSSGVGSMAVCTAVSDGPGHGY